MNVPILARRVRALVVAFGATAAIIVLAAFALAGGASADHDDATHFSAESMAHGSFAKVVSDPSAYSGQALLYADSGLATRSVALPFEGERIAIRARNGSIRNSSVGLRVLIDGVVVGERLITSTSYTFYSFEKAIPAGTHTVGVQGYSLTGKDQAYLDAVRIVHQAPPPDADGDGVADSGDLCEGHPDSVDPDSDGVPSGCDSDRDGDGKANDADYRPDDPSVQNPPPPACEGKQVTPAQDLDQVVNSDPAYVATTFCVQGNANGTPATYNLSNTLNLKSGDKLIGVQVPLVQRGPASYPGTPLVNLRNGNDLSRLVNMQGSNVVIKWVDVAGAKTRHTADGGPVNGTGVGIGAGQADHTSVIQYVRTHDNEHQGIGGTKGLVVNSECFSNGSDQVFWGFGAACAKTTFESEWGFNYVHDNPANGLWADQGTHNTPEQGLRGWHVHDNLVVDNGRWGIRYEYSAMLPAGEHSPEGSEATQPNVLVEDNRVAGNGYGGLIQQAAQQGIWRNNTLGSQTVAGVSYAGNALGIVASDSHKSTDLWDADFYNNDLNGDTTQGCELPDSQVDCQGNTM